MLVLVLGVRNLRVGRQYCKHLSRRLKVQPVSIDPLYVAVCTIPYQCIIHEDAIVDLPKVDCVYVGYREHTFRICEEVAEGTKPFANCMTKKPPEFGKKREAKPCCSLSPLGRYPDHLA